MSDEMICVFLMIVYCANVDVYDYNEPILVMKILEDAIIGDDVKEL